MLMAGVRAGDAVCQGRGQVHMPAVNAKSGEVRDWKPGGSWRWGREDSRRRADAKLGNLGDTDVEQGTLYSWADLRRWECIWVLRGLRRSTLAAVGGRWWWKREKMVRLGVAQDERD